MLFEEGRFLDDGDLDHLIVNLGLRWDGSDLEVPRDLARDLPDGFSSDYSAVTGSLGVVSRLNRIVSLAGNLGRGWRPPNAFELFANGCVNTQTVQIRNGAPRPRRGASHPDLAFGCTVWIWQDLASQGNTNRRSAWEIGSRQALSSQYLSFRR